MLREALSLPGLIGLAGMAICFLVLFLRRRKRPGMTWGQMLLYSYVFGVALGHNDFTKLALGHFGEVPLFISEVVIVLLVAALVFSRRNKVRAALSPMVWPLFGFMVVGALYAVKGVPKYGVWALKDFAVVYYSAFAWFAGLLLFDQRDCIRMVGIWYLGGVGYLLVELAKWTLGMAKTSYGSPFGFDRYGNAGVLICVFLVAISLANILRLKWPRSLYPTSVMLLAVFIVVIAQQRKAVAGCAVSALVLVTGMIYSRQKFLAARHIFAMTAVLVLVLLFMPFIGDELSHFTTAVHSGFVDWRSDDTFEFRLAAWDEALVVFGESPLLGVGFGPIIHTYPVSPDHFDDFGSGNPHNAYLTILMRMGIMGLTAVVLIFLTWFLRIAAALRTTRTLQRGRDAVPWLVGLMAAVVGTLVYGAATYLFERPFAAASIWLMVGVSYCYATCEIRRRQGPAT